MTLFTKPNCKNCVIIKEAFDIEALGINIEELTPDNPAALAHLAWHESVQTADIAMPILVLDDCTVVAGRIEVEKYLKDMR